MIDPDVRRGVTADALQLHLLEREARATLVEARGGRRWLDAHPEVGPSWTSAVIERTVFVAVIPADDAAEAARGDRRSSDTAVGYLVADLVADPMLVVRIDQVYVTADARQLGFGDALVAAAMAWGRSAGAELIEAETLPGDRELKNLYERAGVTARLIVVSKNLAQVEVPDD